MLSGNAFGNVRSVYVDNPSSADFGADIVLTNGSATLFDTASSPLLYYVGQNFTKTIRDLSGNPDLTFTFKKSSSVSISTGGTFTLTSAVGGEVFPYGSSGTLTSTEKQDFILVVDQERNINLSATVTKGGTNTFTANNSVFSKLNVGDKIVVTGIDGTFRITSIGSGTSANVTPVFPDSVNGNVAFKAYKIGDAIDLRSKGSAAGTERSVTISSNTSLSFNLQEAFPSTTSASHEE